MADMTRPGVLCWPGNDTYFRYGVEAMVALSPRLPPGEMYFIHLCGHTLKAFLDALPSMTEVVQERKVVIIASPRLLPLVRYWRRSIPHVHALFSSDVPVRRIIDQLVAPPPDQTARGGRQVMSARDITLVRQCLRAGGFGDLARAHGCSHKSLYGRKAFLARMLGLRKLEYIIFVD